MADYAPAGSIASSTRMVHLWTVTHADPQLKIRLPSDLKDRVQEAARMANRTMNAEIVARLEEALNGQSPADLMKKLSELEDKHESLKRNHGYFKLAYSVIALQFNTIVQDVLANIHEFPEKTLESLRAISEAALLMVDRKIFQSDDLSEYTEFVEKMTEDFLQLAAERREKKAREKALKAEEPNKAEKSDTPA